MRAYVEAKVQWLREQPLRRSELFLFFSRGDGNGPLDRGVLGEPLLFKNVDRLSRVEHARRLQALARPPGQAPGSADLAWGCGSGSSGPRTSGRLHYALLNPGRAGAQPEAPSVELVDNLWNEQLARKEGRHVLEYTEAECLCFESLHEERGYFRQGGLLRRVLTLKVLPESRTRHFGAMPLQALAHPLTGEPFGYTLSVCVHIKPQARAKFFLNQQHKLVSALRGLVHQVGGEDARRDVDDAHTQGAIVAPLRRARVRCPRSWPTLSVSLLLDGRSPRRARGPDRSGAHRLPRWPATASCWWRTWPSSPATSPCFPGAGRYQVRRKGCTTRNAADFLPLFEPWRGLRSRRTASSRRRSARRSASGSSTPRWAMPFTASCAPTPAPASR